MTRLEEIAKKAASDRFHIDAELLGVPHLLDLVRKFMEAGEDILYSTQCSACLESGLSRVRCCRCKALAQVLAEAKQ